MVEKGDYIDGILRLSPELAYRFDTFFDVAKHRLRKARRADAVSSFEHAKFWSPRTAAGELSRASARPLPAIIDTPMARLDVEHRNQLVERYFPNASHQVIILSTDTEIEQNSFDQLRPAVARAYLLNYDEATKATVPAEGYFWDDEPLQRREEVSA